MARLNQIIAVASGKKSEATKALGEVYHKLQVAGLFSGIARNYRPKDDDGDKLPPENKQVQFTVASALEAIKTSLKDCLDVIATQEYGNCSAAADVVVEGEVVLPQVPVTYLLFLEKQLLNVRNTFEKLPVLDPGKEWVQSPVANCWATKPVESTKSTKVPASQVLYEATKEHPAQVQAYSKDVLAGYWTTTEFSGAIQESEKASLIARVGALQNAVKQAREEANSVTVSNVKVADSLFDYLLGPS